MPDGRRRSREHWTDTMEAGPGDPPAHVHRLPIAVRIALGGLTGAVALVLVALVLIGLAVYQADQYVKGRGEYRDREAQRLEQQIHDAVCDLLDQLPEGGLLDRPRAKYGCGPGIPLEDLTPEERAELQRPPGAAPAPSPQSLTPAPSTAVPPSLGSGAVPNPPRVTTPSVGPQRPEPVAPTTSPSSPPLVDLEPLTEPVCDALGVVVHDVVHTPPRSSKIDI